MTAKRLVGDLYRQNTAAGAEAIIALLQCDDPRVVYMAATQIMDRTLGRVTDKPQFGDDASVGSRLEVGRLTIDQLRALIEAVEAGAVKAAEDEAIDGEVTG